MHSAYGCADFRWGFVQPGELEPVGHHASDSIRKAVHAYGSTLAACGSASTDACSSIGGLLQKTYHEQVLYLHCSSA